MCASIWAHQHMSSCTTCLRRTMESILVISFEKKPVRWPPQRHDLPVEHPPLKGDERQEFQGVERLFNLPETILLSILVLYRQEAIFLRVESMIRIHPE